MNAIADSKRLTTSLEDYLEAILLLIRQGRVARVRDIASRLKVGMPSVTAALKALAKRNLVNYDPYQVITLTDLGNEVAHEITWRHEVLRRFLTTVMGLDGDSAESNACRMEHAVDDDLLRRLGLLVEFVQRCPRTDTNWLAAFERFCRDGQDLRPCDRCGGGAQTRPDGPAEGPR